VTILLLIVWALTGASPTLADPWSAWFVGLVLCALADTAS
jgi:hypothetical protein